MSLADGLEVVKEFLFPGRYDKASIPPLDGGLTPNDALDAIGEVEISIAEPDDVLPHPDGSLYVTSGSEVVRLSGPEYERRSVVAATGGEAGPLASDPAGHLYVGVAGVGLARIDGSGRVSVVAESADDGIPVHCPTAITVADDGMVYLTDGSTRFFGEDWIRDLLEQNALGRLIRYDPSSGRTTVLAHGLRYPSGITLTAQQDALIVGEAWQHRISRFHLDGGRPQPVRSNLPGYPHRVSTAPDGGYWLAVSALRTQLIEFVLTQRDYVEEMMRTIEPEYWIRPALRNLDSGLEPLQGGQIRKLGLLKPWAPPRSYGLAVGLDADGYPTTSLHSRTGGKRHGVTSIRQHDGRLFMAVRGADQVVIASQEGIPA